MGAVVAGIRQDESRTFVLQARRARHTGQLAYTGGFSHDEDRDQAAEGMLDAYGPVNVTLTVPACALLGPPLTAEDGR